ncbi:DinB family protein [Dyella sp.]|uniref:DinB family protein n=1 Tax=Dyella sp. TaxID=1869338 RepID=UPI002ED1F5D8
MTTQSLRRFARYKAWADQMIFEAAAKLPEAELTRPREVVFGSMLAMLTHTYTIDKVFQAHLEGREHGFTARITSEKIGLEDLSRRQRALDDWYVEWADNLDERSADSVVHFGFIGGGEGTMTRAEILLHLVSHTSYHRGFVADMFYGAGVRPPTTDFPVFLRDVPQVS